MLESGLVFKKRALPESDNVAGAAAVPHEPEASVERQAAVRHAACRMEQPPSTSDTAPEPWGGPPPCRDLPKGDPIAPGTVTALQWAQIAPVSLPVSTGSHLLGTALPLPASHTAQAATCWVRPCTCQLVLCSGAANGCTLQTGAVGKEDVVVLSQLWKPGVRVRGCPQSGRFYCPLHPRSSKHRPLTCAKTHIIAVDEAAGVALSIDDAEIHRVSTCPLWVVGQAGVRLPWLQLGCLHVVGRSSQCRHMSSRGHMSIWCRHVSRWCDQVVSCRHMSRRCRHLSSRCRHTGNGCRQVKVPCQAAVESNLMKLCHRYESCIECSSSLGGEASVKQSHKAAFAACGASDLVCSAKSLCVWQHALTRTRLFWLEVVLAPPRCVGLVQQAPHRHLICLQPGRAEFTALLSACAQPSSEQQTRLRHCCVIMQQSCS